MGLEECTYAPVSSMVFELVSKDLLLAISISTIRLSGDHKSRQSICYSFLARVHLTHIKPASGACTALSGGVNIVEISIRAFRAVLHASSRVSTRRALLRNGHRAAWAHISSWAAQTTSGTGVGVVGSRGASRFRALSSAGDVVARSRLKAASLAIF